LLNGTLLSLAIYGQSTANSDLVVTTFDNIVSVSGERIEYPDVSSLFDPSSPSIPGFAGRLVDVAIDIDGSTITIDFENAGSGGFARGFQNTYVFTLAGTNPALFADARVDPIVSNLGLDPEAVFVDGNQIFVNVSGLRYSSDSFVKVDLLSQFSGTSGSERLFATQDDTSLSGFGGGDLLFGSDGDDFIYGESIDATLTGEIAGQVFRMYQSTLGRAPDEVGYTKWLSDLFEARIDLTDMAQLFTTSREFQNTYGNLDDTQFVNLLYQNVLGREADDEGLQFWLDVVEQSTRTDVVLGFSESREFELTTRSTSADFAISQSEAIWTDEIYRVYRATLDRDPDGAGFYDWAGRLGSGTTFDVMINGFVQSVEFINTYGNLGDTAFVEQLYQNVLNRASDSAGLQSWLDLLDEGALRATVVRGFSESREFQNSTRADLANWVRTEGTQDVIDAGAGNNTVVGGLLQDQFIFAPQDTGNTRIVDFESWDQLNLSGFDLADTDAALAQMEQRGADVVFSQDGVNVTLLNTQLADLTSDQLILA